MFRRTNVATSGCGVNDVAPRDGFAWIGLIDFVQIGSSVKAPRFSSVGPLNRPAADAGRARPAARICKRSSWLSFLSLTSAVRFPAPNASAT